VRTSRGKRLLGRPNRREEICGLNCAGSGTVVIFGGSKKESSGFKNWFSRQPGEREGGLNNDKGPSPRCAHSPLQETLNVGHRYPESGDVTQTIVIRYACSSPTN
jgi:hypothetical protein